MAATGISQRYLRGQHGSGRILESNLSLVLEDWAVQAGRLGVAEPHPRLDELEDSAVRLVEQIIADMRQPQTEAERDAKAIGDMPGNAPGVNAAARAHAEQRLSLGLSLSDMVAEYRALRASVVRHWFSFFLDNAKLSTRPLVRFNKAVDQALTESITCDSHSLQRIRDISVGILAHDLRTPLGAIANSAQYLMRKGELPEQPFVLRRTSIEAARERRLLSETSLSSRGFVLEACCRSRPDPRCSIRSAGMRSRRSTHCIRSKP